MPPQQAARPPSRFDCLSAEGLVTRLVTGLQRCYELFFFHLNLGGVFCAVERLLFHESSLLRGASLLCLKRLLLCGGVFSSVERRSRCCYHLFDVLLPELAWCLPLAWSLTHGRQLRGSWHAATRPPCEVTSA